MSSTIEVTISGIDCGGFPWQNVFYVEEGSTGTELNERLAACASRIETDIVPALADCMNDASKIFNIGCKQIEPETSYTYNLPQDVVGTRAGDSSTGAIAGRIDFLPGTGTAKGRTYVQGAIQADVKNDVITNTYLALLEALGDAYMLLDGSNPTFFWQLIIFNKAEETSTNAVDYQVAVRPTTLNKRMRN